MTDNHTCKDPDCHTCYPGTAMLRKLRAEDKALDNLDSGQEAQGWYVCLACGNMVAIPNYCRECLPEPPIGLDHTT